MRKLSQSFIEAMNSGFLSEIRQAVIIDKDLDLEIRENYVNIYFKGNSLLNLKEVNSKYYRVLINPRILGKLTNPMCRFNLSATQENRKGDKPRRWQNSTAIKWLNIFLNQRDVRCQASLAQTFLA